MTEKEKLHVIIVGAAGRVQVRVLHWESGKSEAIDNNQVRWNYDNLIGSSGLELDNAGNILNEEEYYPYGGTAVLTARSEVEVNYKTIRYSGKERDATGLYYYGYRYYQSWAGRWLSADPAGTVDGLNLYRMVRNNPIVFFDSDGRAPNEGNNYRGELKEKTSNHSQTLQYELFSSENNLSTKVTKTPPSKETNVLNPFDMHFVSANSAANSSPMFVNRLSRRLFSVNPVPTSSWLVEPMKYKIVSDNTSQLAAHGLYQCTAIGVTYKNFRILTHFYRSDLRHKITATNESYKGEVKPTDFFEKMIAHMEYQQPKINPKDVKIKIILGVDSSKSKEAFIAQKIGDKMPIKFLIEQSQKNGWKVKIYQGSSIIISPSGRFSQPGAQKMAMV